MSFQPEWFSRPPTDWLDLAIAKGLLANPTFDPEFRPLVQYLVNNHGRCVTQRELAHALFPPPATCPYEYGSREWIYFIFDWFEAMTRRIRSIMETLRTDERYGGLIICSFTGGKKWGAGYCLEWEDGQVEAYMKRIGHEAPATASTRLWNKEKQETNFRNRNAA